MSGIDRTKAGPLLAFGGWVVSLAAAAQPSVLPPAPPAPPAPHAPRIDALPTPAVSGAIDLAALARGFALEPGAAMPATREPRLLVFVSLAMPEATLRRLIEQASRAPAHLVLRGMADGSLTRTAARVRELLGDRPLSIQIDPRLFDRYDVRRVPTFVLERRADSAASCSGQQCASGALHVSVSGDVSLDYALRQMRNRAPGLARDAAQFLARLER